MLLTVNKVNENISGVLGTKKYSIAYNAEVYKALLKLEQEFSQVETLEDAKKVIVEATALTELKSESLITQACPYLVLDTKTNLFYLTQNGQVSSVAIPKVLSDKIIESYEKQLSFEPLVKAWIWFLRNPNFTPEKAILFANYLTTTVVDLDDMHKFMEEDGFSQEKATELATYNDVSITTNGLLSTYKYATIVYHQFDKVTGEKIARYPTTYDEISGKEIVTLPENAEDYHMIPPIKGLSGDEYYTNEVLGHTISVGHVHRLPDWSYVNTNDKQSCVKGLHLGGKRYVSGYGGTNRVLLNCFANPMHIGAFDRDGSGAARMLEYFVHSAEFAPNKSLYRESTYLARNEEQWAELRTEAIKNSEEIIARLNKYQSEINAF